MREIKFRAWDVLSKEMRHVSFVEFDAAGALCNVALLSPPTEGRNRFSHRFEERANGEYLDLMQLTGLKDKNGKEIYEGDVVLVWGDLLDGREVVFERGAFYVKCVHKFDSDHLVGYYEASEITVIDNIYETPHLLK